MNDRVAGVPAGRGLSIAALATGLGSFLLAVIYFVALSGMAPLLLAAGVGLLGVVLGIAALVKRGNGGMALIGIVSGAITVVVGLGVILFALLFVGAI